MLSVLTFVLALLVCTDAAAATDAAPSTYASELGTMINGYREQHGLSKLALVDDLSRLAQQHSEDMANEHRMSHEGFRQRFGRSGRAMCVENVGWNYHGPAAQLDAWKNSPVHDHNLRDARVAQMGIGNAHDYVTWIACS